MLTSYGVSILDGFGLRVVKPSKFPVFQTILNSPEADSFLDRRWVAWSCGAQRIVPFSEPELRSASEELHLGMCQMGIAQDKGVHR